MGTDAPSLKPRTSRIILYFVAIFAAVAAGAAYGLLFKDGAWTVDHAYRYSYDLRELKAPLIAAIVADGWTYQPVVFFHPLLG